MSDLSGRTTIVVGASRGLGRRIATAFAEAGAPVVAVSRTAAVFAEPASGADTIHPELADAGDATVAASLLGTGRRAQQARSCSSIGDHLESFAEDDLVVRSFLARAPRCFASGDSSACLPDHACLVPPGP